MKEMPPQPKETKAPEYYLERNVTAASERLSKEGELLSELTEITDGKFKSKSPEDKAQLLEKIKTLLYAREETDVLLRMTISSLK